MNICIKIRAEGRKETAMWMSVDRIEDMTVILLDDEEKPHPLPVDRYRALTGLPPRESDVLEVTLDGDLILTAAYSESETKRREEAARKRLNRLFGRK
jgi:hypothetical protein